MRGYGGLPSERSSNSTPARRRARRGSADTRDAAPSKRRRAAPSRATRQSLPLLDPLTNEQESAIDTALSWDFAPRYLSLEDVPVVSQGKNMCCFNAALSSVLLPLTRVISDILSRRVGMSSGNAALLNLLRRWTVLIRFGGARGARFSSGVLVKYFQSEEILEGAPGGRNGLQGLCHTEQDDAVDALNRLLAHLTPGWVGHTPVKTRLEPKRVLSVVDRFTVPTPAGSTADNTDELRFDVPEADRDSFLAALSADEPVEHRGEEQLGYFFHATVPSDSRRGGVALSRVLPEQPALPIDEALTVNTYAHPARRVRTLRCALAAGKSCAVGGAVDVFQGRIAGGIANNEALAEAMLPSFALSRTVSADAEEMETAQWGVTRVQSGLTPRQARLLRSGSEFRCMFMCAWHVGVYQLGSGSPFGYIRETFSHLVKVMEQSRRRVCTYLQWFGLPRVQDDCAASHRFRAEDLCLDPTGTNLMVRRNGLLYRLHSRKRAQSDAGGGRRGFWGQPRKKLFRCGSHVVRSAMVHSGRQLVRKPISTRVFMPHHTGTTGEWCFSGVKRLTSCSAFVSRTHSPSCFLPRLHCTSGIRCLRRLGGIRGPHSELPRTCVTVCCDG